MTLKFSRRRLLRLRIGAIADRSDGFKLLFGYTRGRHIHGEIGAGDRAVESRIRRSAFATGLLRSVAVASEGALRAYGGQLQAYIWALQTYIRQLQAYTRALQTYIR